MSIVVLAQNPYKVTIDLTDVTNDQVPVTIELPKITEDVVEYHMAKVVPGTYSISDFGRFVTDFKAYDKKGREIPADPMGLARNIYRIEDAKKLRKITYRVHDTFDKAPGYDDNIVFEPGGTSIEADKDVFVMNTFGFVGYVDGMKFNPYEVTVKHDENLYGATSLKRSSSTNSMDVFTAENFNFLADAPIMFCEPDTVTKEIAGAEIIVSVYSPNDKLGASEIMDNIYDLMVAQSKYLGGKLPVDRYAYLIYLMDYNSLSGSMGALEHSYSSLYTLPEASGEQLAQTVRDVAAHEFLHIVTPLNIHSEEIHNFDYIDPKMSEHLWLYEGVTEYSSMHVQVRYNLYDRETFLDQIKEKLTVAEQFPLVSFTEMSENILEPKYERMYTNVYYKGALIAMCLDLHLIKYSNGQKDLPWLMRELAREYGKNQAFKDEELFNKIEQLTYPEVGNFLRTHVSGKEPLPIKEVLGWAGVNYIAEQSNKQATLGNVALGLNADQQLAIMNVSQMNDFGKAMGYEQGDVILALNDQEITLPTVRKILEEFVKTTKEGDQVKMKIKRGDEELVLSAEAELVEGTDKHVLNFAEDITDEQKQVREAWLNARD